MAEIDVEYGVRRWLEAGPTMPPDRVIESAIAHALTHPRRAGGLAAGWRALEPLFRLPRTVVPVARLALLLLALALALAGAFALYVGGQRQDSLLLPAPRNGLIAFTYGGDIWTVPADGSAAPRAVASVAGLDEMAPAWSPDGRRLALWSIVRSNVGDRQSGIEVMNADGSERRSVDTVLVLHEGYSDMSGWIPGMPDDGGWAWDPFGTLDAARLRNISWSPDGRSVAYALNWDVRVTDVASGKTVRLYPDGLGEMPVFSPDGTRVAFFGQAPTDVEGRESQATVGLFVVALDGGAPTRLPLADVTRLTPTSAPAWVDGGAAIVTDGCYPGCMLLSRFPVDGGPVDYFLVAPAAWPITSPDGRWLSFLVQKTGADPEREGRWVADSRGTRARVQVPGSSRLAWSPDGTWIAFDVRERCARGYLASCVAGLATAPAGSTVEDAARLPRLWTLPADATLTDNPWMDIAWQPVVR